MKQLPDSVSINGIQVSRDLPAFFNVEAASQFVDDIHAFPEGHRFFLKLFVSVRIPGLFEKMNGFFIAHQDQFKFPRRLDVCSPVTIGTLSVNHILLLASILIHISVTR
jgi:hypothetical protein